MLEQQVVKDTIEYLSYDPGQTAQMVMQERAVTENMALAKYATLLQLLYASESMAKNIGTLDLLKRAAESVIAEFGYLTQLKWQIAYTYGGEPNLIDAMDLDPNARLVPNFQLKYAGNNYYAADREKSLAGGNAFFIPHTQEEVDKANKEFASYRRIARRLARASEKHHRL
jgi:hypothetical protein